MAKPNREIFDHVVREAHIDCAHTVYVDDLEKNRRAGAQFAGWQTVSSIDELKTITNNP
jgi:HAD superfamily hydrolase (TIGR01509 family)